MPGHCSYFQLGGGHKQWCSPVLLVRERILVVSSPFCGHASGLSPLIVWLSFKLLFVGWFSSPFATEQGNLCESPSVISLPTAGSSIRICLGSHHKQYSKPSVLLQEEMIYI